MSFSGFRNRGEKSPEDTSGQTAEKFSFRIHRSEAPATYIDASSELDGKLRCKETIRIDGAMKGEIHCEETVIVSPGACVEANISAESAVIGGEVRGDIIAKRKITLEKDARVTGDLATPGIVIQEGATLKGRIVIGSDEEPAAKTATPTRSTEASSSAAKPARQNGGTGRTPSPSTP
jgi:cytoskeletal protein CcmA (bactofilin family)